MNEHDAIARIKRLSHSINCADEIAEVIERLIKERDGLVEKLDVIHERAMQEEAFPSAINAVKTQAQLLGYMDQVVTINHNVRAAELSLEDLRALVSKELSERPALEDNSPSIIEAEYSEVGDGAD